MDEDPCLSGERETPAPPAPQGSGGQGGRNCYRTGLQLLLPGGHVSAAVPAVTAWVSEVGAQARARATVGGFNPGAKLGRVWAHPDQM